MTDRDDDSVALRPDSLILRGGTLLTLDAGARVIRGGDLVVTGGRIAAVGGDADRLPGARILDVSGCLVLPGLIQGHVHLGQTFFRGLAEGRRLLPWLRERIWPLEAAHDDDSAYWCALLGATECLLGGTTTIQEIGIGPGARGLLAAIADSGLRALAGMCLMDSGEGLPEGLREDADTAVSRSIELGREFESRPGDKLRYLLNPRFILTCSDTLWQGIREAAGAQGWPIHTHALEQQEETEAVRRLKGGLDEIEYFDDNGILAADLRIAHGVWMAAGHFERVKRHRFSVVHCPSANLKLGSGIADIVGIRRHGVPVGIGADGAPCNNDMDVLEEVRLAALLQHATRGPESFSGLDALRLATSEGARAIGLEDEIGTLEPGKRADLLVLGLDRPELVAAAAVDLHDLVAFGASRASVRHVLVDGEPLVEEGRLTRLDLPAIRGRATLALDALLERSGIAF